jgi:hypothetical protein
MMKNHIDFSLNKDGIHATQFMLLIIYLKGPSE